MDNEKELAALEALREFARVIESLPKARTFVCVDNYRWLWVEVTDDDNTV